MSKFSEEFERIVSELKAHPQVNFVGSQLEGPAERTDIEASMKSVGMEPVKEIVDFYAEHNGAYLEWGIKDREYQWTGIDGYPDYGSAPGLINMLGHADVFTSGWQDDYVINPLVGDDPWSLAYPGQEDPGEEVTTAVVVDNFNIYYHSDMLLGPEPLIVVASDHGADLSCSDFLTFPQYLELVIARYGSSPYRAVGIGWSRPAQRVTAIEKPSLDDLISTIIKEEDEQG